MHILGITNGTIGGNSEILLKAALKAAQEADSSISVSWVHIPSVSIPVNPMPLKDTLDISMGANSAMEGLVKTGEVGSPYLVPDDRSALLNAVLDADAFIFSSPVYSRTPAGTLKAVFDRIGGPFLDVNFAKTVTDGQKNGDPKFANIKVDPRILKKRVAAYMCVGGSLTPDWVPLALPIMNLLVASMLPKCVDQVMLQGYGSPGAVVGLNGGAAMKRAAQLGKNVASQIGKGYEDAEYLGDIPDGACPYCHLAKFELLGGNKICCITCGTQGTLGLRQDGTVGPTWNFPCGVSSLTFEGLQLHMLEIMSSGAAAKAELSEFPGYEEEKKEWQRLSFPLVSLPSHHTPESRI